MGDWQPIATAPKDGTAVLLWAKDLRFPGAMAVAWYGRTEDRDWDWWMVTDGKFGPWALRGPSPTHWMPLPSTPAPKPDAVCEHGTALDVHCCNCHGGFLFESASCVCNVVAAAATAPSTD